MARPAEIALTVTQVSALRKRGWMNSTRERFVNRCLPLRMANQAGWVAVNNARVRARWIGGQGADSVEFERGDNESTFRPTSHFGHGILGASSRTVRPHRSMKPACALGRSRG